MKAARAFILAAGLGTRLRPLSERVPKPAWPFFDEPIAAEVIGRLAASGVNDFIVNLHHRADYLRQALEKSLPRSISVKWSVEEEILGTGGALAGWLEELGTGPFFLANADTYRALDQASMLRRHSETGGAATLSLAPLPPETKGPIGLDQEGRVVRFLEVSAPGACRETASFAFTGMHLLEPAVLEGVAEAAASAKCFCINADVHKKLIGRGLRFYGYLPPEAEGFWSDLGTPHSYLGAHFHFMDTGAAPAGSKGTFYDRDAVSAGGGFIFAPAYLGPGVRVGEGAVAGPYAVLGEGAALVEGVKVERCVVWRGATVEEDAFEEVVSEQGEALGANGSMRYQGRGP